MPLLMPPHLCLQFSCELDLQYLLYNIPPTKNFKSFLVQGVDPSPGNVKKVIVNVGYSICL